MWRLVVLLYPFVAASLPISNLPDETSAILLPFFSGTDTDTPHNSGRVRLRRAHDPRKGYRYEVQFSPNPENLAFRPNQQILTQNENIVSLGSKKVSHVWGDSLRGSDVSLNRQSERTKMYEPPINIPLNTHDSTYKNQNRKRIDNYSYLSDLAKTMRFIQRNQLLEPNSDQSLNNELKTNIAESKNLETSQRQVDKDKNKEVETNNGFLNVVKQFEKPKFDVITQFDNYKQEPSFYLPPQYEPTTTSTSYPLIKSDGYIYEKPSNQLNLPNEDHHGYDHHNNASNSEEEDDTIEILPQNSSSQQSWLNEDPTTKTLSHNIFFENNPNLYLSPSKNNGLPIEDNGYLFEKPINQLTLPSEKHENLQMPPNSISSPLKPMVGSGSSTKTIPQSSSQEVSSANGNVNQYGETKFRPSSDLVEVQNEKISPDSETSLSVKFAGSVFNEEGLPHLNPEMVLPVDYSFSYEVRGRPLLGHEETRGQTMTRGRYWVGLPDGRVQTVEYSAGPQGFVPKVTYRVPRYIVG